MSKVAKSGPVQKPYPEFPLTRHPRGQWCKKIRSKLHPNGKLYYFGPLSDPMAALDRWLSEKDQLLAGHIPDRSNGEVLTVKLAIDAFLEAKEQRADAGEITRRHFDDLQTIGTLLADLLVRGRSVDSLTPSDFSDLRAKLAKRYGPAALLRTMICIRSIFKHAADNRLIERPVFYGSGFSLPNRKDLRLQRASKPERLFSAPQLTTLLKAASVPMRAMILLGINCGLGNSDCGNLEQRHLDLEGGWLNYPRPKTGIARKAKLWGETVKALREAIAERPEPKHDDDAGLVFITKYGESWAKHDRNNPVSAEFRKLLDSAGLHQAGLGFYSLRHCFETVAGASKDQVATSHVMGHVDSSMAGLYRERIGDDRLEAVSEHVHQWLYGDTKPVSKPVAKPRAKRAPRAKPKAERPALRVVG